MIKKDLVIIIIIIIFAVGPTCTSLPRPEPRPQGLTFFLHRDDITDTQPGRNAALALTEAGRSYRF